MIKDKQAQSRPFASGRINKKEGNDWSFKIEMNSI